MPEPVNSVVVGDPENFQAEHSEHEPELVTVKPVATRAGADQPADHDHSGTPGKSLADQFRPAERRYSDGRCAAEIRPARRGAFSSRRIPSPSLIAETQRLDMQGKVPEAASNGTPMASLAALTKTAPIGGSGGIDEKSSPGAGQAARQTETRAASGLVWTASRTDRCRSASQSRCQRGSRRGRGRRCPVFRREPGKPCD